MEWFKHSTGSHDDPDISDAMDEFGDAGYSVFFIALEIYGQEYNHIDSEGWLTISLTFLGRKLRKSSTKVQQILNFYSERKRLSIKITSSKISIKCPKYIEIASNWAKRKNTTPTEGSTEGSTEGPTAIEEEEKKNKNKKKNKKESIKKKELENKKVEFILPENIKPEIWDAFVEHRKNLKKPLTNYAKKLILKKLDEIGQDKNAVINQSILKGWQDVFALKENDNEIQSNTNGGKWF